jgi:osmoprotectant transport system substrate-binding protein
MVMSAKTPYENKDAIATTKDYAETHGLKSIADLGKLSSFTLGARPEFEKLYLGLKGLQDVYGLDRATFKAVPLGEQYRTLDDGQAEAVNAFTTDPQLVDGDYQVLSDPKLLFGSQNAVLVVGQDDLKRIGGDTFMKVVDTVNARLTEDVMVGLNTEVTQGQSEVEVAGRFLEREGLTKPLGER